MEEPRPVSCRRRQPLKIRTSAGRGVVLGPEPEGAPKVRLAGLQTSHGGPGLLKHAGVSIDTWDQLF